MITLRWGWYHRVMSSLPQLWTYAALVVAAGGNVLLSVEDNDAVEATDDPLAMPLFPMSHANSVSANLSKTLIQLRATPSVMLSVHKQFQKDAVTLPDSDDPEARHGRFTVNQLVFLIDYVGYCVVCIMLWHSRILRPLKLFAVFLHELSHAIAVWLTCNKVEGIEVHADMGGLTHWSTSPSRLIASSMVVLPAGYLGSALWGGAIVVACSQPRSFDFKVGFLQNVDASGLMACVLIFFLLVAVLFSMCGKSERKDYTLLALSVGMILLLVALLYFRHESRVEIPWSDVWLRKVLLLIGTMNTIFSTYDIWEDCIHRHEERSDVFRFAMLIRCPCATRFIGTAWFVSAILTAAAAMWISVMSLQIGQRRPFWQQVLLSPRVSHEIMGQVAFVACAWLFKWAVSRFIVLQ
eukprot:TRINITY_DN75535_c0_g1_i1.p1 TRINITY_DN75535_c0_g1~~TRINITY_DN75535_c0_g1_i1.p1  ORF type:complete len:409 (+),score=44.40 TRINITY_DN75535_c0_g1_i1:214-1440(+)